MEKGEMEEIKRHFGVVAEGLGTEIRQVAEGHGAIREEIKRFSLLLLLSPPRRNDAIDATGWVSLKGVTMREKVN